MAHQRIFLGKIRSLPERTRFILASFILGTSAIFIFYGWSMITSSRLYDMSSSTSQASGVGSLGSSRAGQTDNDLNRETKVLNEQTHGLLNEIKGGLEDMTSLVTDGVKDLGGKPR